MTEQWLPLSDYPYEVSSLGRVRNRRGRVLRPGADKDGYLLICLCKEGRQRSFAVHRLVASTFHGEHRNELHIEVAHLDGDRANASADNLKWVSKVENHVHKRVHGTHQEGELNPRAKLTAAQAADVRRRALAGERVAHLAREFGLHKKTVSDIRDGKRWRCLPKDQQARAVGIARKDFPCK